MTRRILLLVPLLAAADVADAPVQYTVRISGTALAVVARQGPDGIDAQAETRPREASALLTVSTTDSAGGTALFVRADTVVVPAPPAPAGAELRGHESATGATWQGLAPAGSDALRLTLSGPASARLLDDAVLFLVPRTPGTLRPGATWADTMRFAVDGGRSRSSGVTISEYRVTGGDAGRGWDIERSFRGDRTLRMETPDGEMLTESSSTGSAAYTVAPSGAVASMRLVRTQRITMHIPQFDEPLSAETSDTVEVSRR